MLQRSTKGQWIEGVLAVCLLSCTVVSSAVALATAADRATEAGPEAAAAYAQIGSGHAADGCASFYRLMRQSVADPWVYRGAGLCGATVKGQEAAFQETVAACPPRSPLVLFARGMFHHYRKEHDAAEPLLRQVVEGMPELALAWNALGAMVRERGDVFGSFALIDRALTLAPGLDLARQNRAVSEQAEVAARDQGEVWNRLLARLDAIPGRWDSLPPALVQPSGKTPEAVIQAASEQEKEEADDVLSRLAGTSSSSREQAVQALLKEWHATEAQLWVPFFKADSQQNHKLEVAGIWVEVGLLLAESAGRSDILLAEAGFAFRLLSHRVSHQELLPIMRKWGTLDARIHGGRGKASILSSFGTTLFEAGLNDEALNAQRQAGALSQQVGNKLGMGRALNEEAAILFRIGHYDDALDAHRKARDLFEQVGSKLGMGSSWSGEADVLFRKGRYAEALYAHRKARDLFEQRGSKLGMGNAWGGEADILSLLGRNDDALNAQRKARALFEQDGYEAGMGNSWEGEADTLLLLGRNDEGLKAYRHARIHFEQIGSKLGIGKTWNGEAKILFLEGRNDEALNAHRQARVLFEQDGDKVGIGNTWRGEAVVFLKAEKFPEALNAATRAFELASEMEDINNQMLALLTHIGALVALERFVEAASASENLLALHALRRETGITDWDKTYFSRGISPAFDFLIPYYVEQAHRPLDALQRAEQAHAPSLQEQLATQPMNASLSEDTKLIERRREVHKALARVRLQEREAASPVRQLELDAERHQLDEQLYMLDWELTHSLRAHAPAQGSQAPSRPLSSEALKTIADQVGPTLFFYAAEKQMLAFVLRPGQPVEVVPISATWGELTRHVQAIRYDLANGMLWAGKADQDARELWDLIIKPVVPLLEGFPRLTIIPHGPLHNLPFAALLDPEGLRLVEHWGVTMAPSLSVLLRLRDRRDLYRATHPEPTYVGLASGPKLGLSGKMVKTVADLFPGTAVEQEHQEDVTFADYEQIAPQASHLLLASRGAYVSDSWTETYLQLETDKIELDANSSFDDRLRAIDVGRIPLRADLVVLAACDTAKGDALLSDDRQDLSRAFLLAGAASVLGTLWKIPADQRSVDFVKDFYTAYRRGVEGKPMDKGEALQWVQQQSIARHDPPNVWAAWVLIGDGR